MIITIANLRASYCKSDSNTGSEWYLNKIVTWFLKLYRWPTNGRAPEHVLKRDSLRWTSRFNEHMTQTWGLKSNPAFDVLPSIT
jgi:hypothetical protein